MERLHVHKTHKIEYADTEFFDNGIKAAVNNILVSIDGTWYSDSEYPEGSDEIEVQVDDFEAFIEDLENMTDEEFDEEFYKPILREEWSREFVIKGFKQMLENRDPNNTFINFTWA